MDGRNIAFSYSGERMVSAHVYAVVVAIELIIRAVGQQQPTISYISQAKTVNIGDTVDLDCSVQYAYDYPVLWVKVSKP